jgi:hypothetical protein
MHLEQHDNDKGLLADVEPRLLVPIEPVDGT